MRNCNDCYFWDQKPSTDTGRCCGNPPAVTLVPVQQLGGQGLSVVTYWPETKATDRCGKWEERAKWPVPSDDLQTNLKLA